MKGYGIRSNARGRWGAAVGSRHCNIGMGRTAEPRQSEPEDSRARYFARQVKKAIRERGAVECFSKSGSAVGERLFWKDSVSPTKPERSMHS